MAKDAAPEYGADQITVLEGLEPVRKRPGMYIGSTTSKGLHHLIWEIVDNAVDEALAGFCSEITVDIDPAHEVITVSDNGRGVPVGKNAKTGESALDLVFTKLHAGGKFGDGGYKVSGGLHGVGASVTNALSEYLDVEVKRDEHVWTAKYARGKSTQPVTKGKKITKKDGTGTRVEWKFDREIFDADAKYSLSTIEQRLREKSYLVRGLKFRFVSQEKGEQVFLSKNGIADYIKELNSEREAVHPGVIFFSSDDLPQYLGEEGIPVEVALQWTQGSDERVYSFANVVPTPEGGAHVTGLRRAITRALNNYAYETGKLKKDKSESLEGKDIFEGLAAAVTVKVEDPQFEGQTKQKLNNAEANSATFSFLYAAFTDWLADKDNAKQAKAILDRCLLAREIRLAKGKISKKLRNEATSIFTDSNLPGKLADCLDTVEPDEREIFVVEGDSAAGSAKGARDANFQAILPIRGKILNVMGAKNGKAFDNAEIEGILTALGGRKDVIGKNVVATLEPDNRRYGKCVILTDADVDGAHIANLLLTMFVELFPTMVHEGRVFLARPPLFKINLDARGDKFVYAYDDKELSELLKQHKRSGSDVSRFKGLGEMNPENLAETVFDPATRQLMQVRIEDMGETTEVLNLIMGSKAEPRRVWLEDIGLKVED